MVAKFEEVYSSVRVIITVNNILAPSPDRRSCVNISLYRVTFRKTQ